jgi:hypothetical protein
MMAYLCADIKNYLRGITFREGSHMPCGQGLLAEIVDNSVSIAENGLLKSSLAISPIVLTKRTLNAAGCKSRSGAP